MSENIQAYSASNQDVAQNKPSDLEPALVNENASGDSNDWLRDAELALSPQSRKATYGGKELPLTSAEFNILEHLLRNRGCVLSREDLVQAALGRHLGALDRSVDVHISRLRKKLINSGARETRIRAIRGVGYIYAVTPANGHS